MSPVVVGIGVLGLALVLYMICQAVHIERLRGQVVRLDKKLAEHLGTDGKYKHDECTCPDSGPRNPVCPVHDHFHRNLKN